MNLSTIEITGNICFQPKVKILGDIELANKYTITGSVNIAGGGETIPIYTGPYTVTPTQYTQILSTENKKAIQDITVNPIPSNYGLITWNGSYLMVS